MVEKKTPTGGRAGATRSRRTTSGKSSGAGEHLSCEQAAGPVGGTALIDGYGFASLPVVWAEVDGLAVVEGDIVIGTVEEAQARDVATLTSDEGEILQSVGISGAQFRWPNGVVPFEIDAGLTNPSRVHNAIAHWHAKTPLRLVPRNGEGDFVRFVNGGGCSSAVGRRGGQQNVTLGPSCSVGNTIHEIGHAVGLWHEQSREDRDAFVRIEWANIESGKEHNFNQHINDGDDLGAYDYGSVMHYPTTAFSKNGQPTIVPVGTVPPGTVIGQRTSLSAGDLAGLKIMYPGLAWPKPVFKDVVKEPLGEGTVTVKEAIKEPVKDLKEPFKEIIKEPRDDVLKGVRDPIKQLRDPQPTLREVVEPLRPEIPVINPALGRSLPFVLGRDSDFVSRYQAAVAQQSGVGAQDAGAGTTSAADLAVVLAEIATALDSVRGSVAALAEQAAAEAGI